VTLINTIALTAWIAGRAINWGQAAINSGLIQSWFADIMIRTGFNGVTWTLSCEAFMYVIFPLLFRWVARIREERLWAWILGTMGAIVAIPCLASLLPGTMTYPGSGLRDWDLYLVMQIPAMRAFEFMLGILLARFIVSGRRLPFGLGTASALLIGAWAVAGMFPGRFQVLPLAAIPCALLIGAAARQDLDGTTPVWARGRWVIRLGEMSFAFYMVHRIVVVFGHLLLGGGSYSTPVAVGLILLFGAVALLLGWVLMALVERPLMNKFGARSKPDVRSVEPPRTDDQTPIAA
jgi:mycarose O-acyltransferase